MSQILLNSWDWGEQGAEQTIRFVVECMGFYRLRASFKFGASGRPTLYYVLYNTANLY